MNLNKEIAKNIFNLDVEPSPEQLQEWETRTKDYSDAWDIYGSELGAAPSRPVGPDYYRIKNYSENMADAFLVVEKMRENGWWLCSNRYCLWFERENPEKFNYTMGPEFRWNEGQDKQGISAEMICIVALKTLEVTA